MSNNKRYQQSLVDELKDLVEQYKKADLKYQWLCKITGMVNSQAWNDRMELKLLMYDKLEAYRKLYHRSEPMPHRTSYPNAIISAIENL